jgi:predicted N-acyltransferase
MASFSMQSHSVQRTAPNEALRYSFFRSIESAGQDWDAAAPPDNRFLQRTYLLALEKAPPIGMRFGYLIFYKKNQPVGVAICQIKYFKGDDNINDLGEASRTPCFFTGLARWFKRRVAGWAAADILICGNMLLSGEHGYYFDYQKVSPDVAAQVLEESLVDVIRRMELEGVKMPVILLKDVAPQRRDSVGEFAKQEGFVEFEIQPCMVLDLSPFADFDTYLGAMSTKYRTRAKRAFKKATELERRELTLADMHRESALMYALYREIANNAGFNMVDLNEEYLICLKENLGDVFRVFGYYHQGQLVAFYSTISNHTEFEAHFLGYQKELNHEYQLYLNILYDIIRGGFEAGCREVVFARTALEIKSSVGAVAHDLYCYLRHQNPVLNRFTGTVLEYLKPVEEWQPRHPFRQE